MTARTSSSSETNFAQASCLSKIKESKWTDIALVTGCAALLVIGILASTGVFNFMGTTNAAYLSYGMYGGAALFLMAEIIKVAVVRCSHRRPTVQPTWTAYPISTIRSQDHVPFNSPVPRNYVSPSEKLSDPLAEEVIQNLKAQAISYVGAKALKDPFEENQNSAQNNGQSALLDYITHILDDPEFQADYKSYLATWKRLRGNSEEYRLVEDTALTFFESNMPG